MCEQIGDTAPGCGVVIEYLRLAEDAYFGRWRQVAQTDPIEANRRMYAIDQLRCQYAWAIPTLDAIQAIARYSPILEIGAGTGYWASILRAYGVNIVAYDAAPPTTPQHNNPYHVGFAGDRSRPAFVPGTTFTEVLEGDASVVARYGASRTLFLCWPPYDDPMAYDCLRAYQGSSVIYIGEGRGDGTGDDAFHALLEQEWHQTERVELPHWDGTHDKLTVWVRQAVIAS